MNRVKLGCFILNLETGELHDEGDNIAHFRTLSSKQLLFMRSLISANGDIVTKTDLINRVWGGHTSPESVTQMVNKLRIIINDVQKKIIINHTGIGYSINFSHALLDDFDIYIEHRKTDINDSTFKYNNLSSMVGLSIIIFISFFALLFSAVVNYKLYSIDQVIFNHDRLFKTKCEIINEEKLLLCDDIDN